MARTKTTQKRGRPATNHTRISLRIDAALADKVRDLAKKEHREISQQIALLLQRGLEANA